MELPNQLELQTLFSGFLFEAGLSAVSVKNYLSDLRHFLSFCASISSQDNPPTVQEIFQSVSKYVSQYTDEQRHSFTPQNTINRRLASIRRFSTFLNVKFGLQNEQNSPSHSPVTSPATQNSDDSDVLPTISKILERFRVYLVNEKKTHSTIKNYLSDLNHFFAWSAKQTPFIDQKLENLLSETQLNAYVTYLRLNHTSTSVINRRQSSIKKFTKYCFLQNFIPDNPFENKPEVPKLAPLSWLERLKSKPNDSHKASRNRFVRLYQRYNSLPFTPYLHLALLVLATSAMVIFGYNQIIKQAAPSAAALPTVPRRQLSFQGRLTDSSGTPIVTAVNVVFKLWNASTAGTQLYTSNTCSITPDSNGIFNTLIGNGTCGQEIASTVFTENRDVFLEITVGSETLTPRQQIATVGYALNSETLQGYPASATATINTIPLVDQNGDINIAASSPTINSTSGTFTVTGQALTLSTAANSGGDIILQPDAIGGGNVQVLGNTTSTDTFRIENANLTSGSLISGYIGNNTATGNLLSLSSGSTETDRFLVGANGRTIINTNGGTDSIFSASSSGITRFTIASNGDLLATGALSGLTGLTVSSGTVTLPNNSINNAEISELDWTKLQSYPTACPAGQAVQAVGDTLTCVDIAAASGNLWQRTSGSLAPLNTSDSLNLGSTATSSALVHLAGTSNENSWINTGKLGIGTTNPTTKLHLAGTSTSDYLQVDTGLNFKTVNDGRPSTSGFSASVQNVAGNVNAGTHYYTYSFVDAFGETNVSGTVGPYTFDATHGQAIITIPVSSDYRVTQRKIYRSIAGDQYGQKLLTTINDNTTTTYTDNTADSGLGSISMWFRPNTTNGVIKIDGYNLAFSDTYLTYFGKGAGQNSVANGGRGTFLGATAGYNNTSGSANTVVGNGALYNNQTGSSNTVVGDTAAYNMLGSYNTIMGNYAGYTNGQPTPNGARNTMVGYGSFYNNSTGANDNTALGYQTAYNLQTGTSNTFLGGRSGFSNVSGTGNVFLGYQSGYSETGSNKLYIENSNSTSPLIYGDFSTDIAAINGSLGIGTTTPTAKLDIVGDASASGSLVLRGTSPATIDVLNGSRFDIQTSAGGDAGLTPRLTINGGGNVGIGLTNPSYKLDVAGDINLTGGIRANSSFGTSGQILSSTGTGVQWIAAPSGGNNSPWTWNTGVIYPFSITDAVNLGNAATASATVHLAGKSGDNSFINTGNFGIGLTNPSYTLDVVGSVNITGSYLVNGSPLTASNWQRNFGSLAPLNITDSINLGATATSSALVHLAGTSGENSFVNTGNLGVGTTTPSRNLVVNGTPNSYVSVTSDDSGLAGILLGDQTLDNVGQVIYNNGNDSLGLWTAGTEKLSITAGGNVGVGITNPSYDLDVAGDINVTGALRDNGSSGTNGQVLTSTGTGIDWVNQSSISAMNQGWTWNTGVIYPTSITDAVNLGNAATASATVHLAGVAGDNSFINTGNFGIGTTTPGSKLTVNGTLTSSGGAINLNDSSNFATNINTGTSTGAVTIGGGALTQTVAINSADWDISTTGVITNSDSYNGLVVTANTGVITTGTWNASLIPLAYGGTNKNMTAVNGGIVWTDSDSMEVTVAGTAGQILQSNGAAAPSWINTSSITGVNQGWTWNTGVLYPTSITDAVNLGNAATASATVHLAGKTGDNSFINTGNFGIGDTTPAATLTVGSGDLFQVAGATGNITTAGDINVNGDNINADGTLAILGATGLSLQATTGTVTLDSIAANQIINIGTSNVARTINMGTGTGVDTINIGTGATGADLITIGSANAGNVTIRSNATLSFTGGTNSVIDFPNFDVATTGDITTAGDINVNGGDIFSSGDLTINPTGGDVFLGVSDNLGLTAATNLIFGGTTSLGETTAANDSGAYLVGVFDNFTYSNGTNVQQVLKDIDSQLALSSNLWQLNSGAIAPLNITNSLILGSAATSSATVHLAGTADDNSFINTGNFGIGLTNPSYKLDVVGDINLTGALRDNGSAGTSGQILTSTGTGIDWVNQSSLSAMNQGWTWNTGVLYPTSITDAVNLGNAATASATVHLAGVAGDNSFIKTGYFGVGTTNPTAILTLESTVENTIRFTDAETLRAIIGISAGAGQITAGSVDNDLVIRNQAGKIMFTTDGGVNNTMVLSGGNVGIGLTNPTYDLDVVGDINLTGQIKLGSFTTAGLPTSIGTGSLIYNTTLNVPQFYNGTAWKSVNYFDRTSDGILYPTNWYDSINLFASTGNGATSSAKIRLSGDIANNTFFVNPVAIGFTTAMESTAILQTSGHILPLNTAANNNLGKIGYSWYNLFLTSGIVDNASGTQVISTELRRLTGANWNVTGNLGVGSTTTPTQALEVTGNATISGVLNTGGSVYVGGDELNVKNGTGKINAGTVDPPYTINGQKYATYMASMIGVKEEVVGNITTTKNDHIPGLGYRALIDLDQQPVGSDLWLFSKTTNIQSHINDLSVLLTPEGKGKAWYEIDPENKILAIYSSNPTSVTYRLTAPRFDSARWTNTRGNSIVGFVINDYNNYSNTTSIFDNPATDPELIAKLDGTYSLIVNGEEVNEVSSLAEGIIANFKAGLAVITDLVAENLTVRTKLVSPLADIDQLKVIDATISGTLYADNIQGQTVDTLNQEINLLNERYSTASAILTDLQAKYGTYGELLGSISEATISADPLALSPLATTSAIIPSDLALNSLNVHTLIANDIMANGSLFAQTVSAYDTDLFIQPSGDKPVHIMANIMNIYPDGKILINGDLLINGSLIAQNIDTQTATVSGTLAVGTSTIATDSANFNQLVTTGLIIASGNNNATQSGLAQTTSNASIGTAVIDQGAEEININNSRVTDTTLIYVTPTSDTKGSVLYVKSKQSGTGFTVAISGGNKPVAITFNYWLVETK